MQNIYHFTRQKPKYLGSCLLKRGKPPPRRLPGLRSLDLPLLFPNPTLKIAVHTQISELRIVVHMILLDLQSTSITICYIL